MPQTAVPEGSTSTQTEKTGYALVMIFYLVTGALGIIYFAFLLFSVWLLDQGSPAAESLMYFLVLGFPGLILGLLNYAWPVGIFLLIRYRGSWRVVVPAAVVVASGVSSFFSKALLLPSWINDVALVLYIITACSVAIDWLARRKLSSRNRPPVA